MAPHDFISKKTEKVTGGGKSAILPQLLQPSFYKRALYPPVDLVKSHELKLNHTSRYFLGGTQFPLWEFLLVKKLDFEKTKTT